MTKRHRSFATEARDDDDGTQKNVTFDIDQETFTCLPEAAGSTILEFVAAAEQGGGAVASRLLWFFEKVMDPEEYARFRAYIDDPKRHVKIELLSDVVGYLAETYTDRPTTPSES